VTDFAALIRALTDSGVEFVLVGGVAATVHGSTRLTRDVDVVYSRRADNLVRLVDALTPIHPYLRGAPPGLPFLFDQQTLTAGLNFTLTTDVGDLDLLGEIAGGGSYAALMSHTARIQLFGRWCHCLTIDQLIAVKRAAGRPRDLEVVAELELIRDRTRGQPSQ
jgi:predicted nucleotidyltransferase